MHTSRRVNIHILDMDGNSVCSEGPLVHDFKEKRFLYSDRPKISISKNTVAVLFRAGHIIPQDSNTLADALVVWNWLTGEELCVSFPSPASLRLGIVHTFHLTLIGSGGELF